MTNANDTQETENSESKPSKWSAWQAVDSSHNINYRTKQEDDLGNGNFVWKVQLSHDDFGIIEFDYEIEGIKANGTINTIKGHTAMADGISFETKLSAQRIVKVSAANVTQV